MSTVFPASGWACDVMMGGACRALPLLWLLQHNLPAPSKGCSLRNGSYDPQQPPSPPSYSNINVNLDRTIHQCHSFWMVLRQSMPNPMPRPTAQNSALTLKGFQRWLPTAFKRSLSKLFEFPPRAFTRSLKKPL